MKHLALFTLIIIVLPFAYLNCQQLEIEGEAKIATMAENNNASDLVVRQNDGTLAKRKVNSLPKLSSGVQDSARTFESDFKLAEMLCNCPNPSPLLMESALENGYPLRHLVRHASAASIWQTGSVPVDSMLHYYSTNQCLAAGISPMLLWDNGVALRDLLGKFYNGGYLYLLDTGGIYSFDGLLAVEIVFNGTAEFGCDGDFISTSNGIGEGENNTNLILTACSTPQIAADKADEFLITEASVGSFEDYFLPSVDELSEIYSVLKLDNKGNFQDIKYWTSSQNGSVNAFTIDFATGNQAFESKSNVNAIIVSRSFGD